MIRYVTKINFIACSDSPVSLVVFERLINLSSLQVKTCQVRQGSPISDGGLGLKRACNKSLQRFHEMR